MTKIKRPEIPVSLIMNNNIDDILDSDDIDIINKTEEEEILERTSL